MQDTLQQESGSHILPQQGRALWYISVSFLILIIASTFMIFLFSQYKTRSLAAIKDEIMQIDREIENINTDKNIVIAKIIQENGMRPSIDLKNIVTQFRLAAIKANVSFEGFTIKDDVISTKLISTNGNNTHPDPVATIITMMNEYAKNDGKEFQLGKITNISGDLTKRTTSIELRLTNHTPNR